MNKPPFKPKKFIKQFKIPIHLPEKKVNNEGIERLFTIVQDGDYNKIKNFISEQNITFNVKNKDGDTVIHKIITIPDNVMNEQQKLDLTKFFIQHGVSISTFNNNNITALHLACKYQYKKIVKLLLDNGVEVNVLDNQMMNPLHYLAQGNIVPCKKKKKIGNLINKNTNNSPLKNLTNNIIDTLYQQQFNIQFQNIYNTTKELNTYYPDFFNQLLNNYQKDINNIILLEITTSEKQQKMNDKIINLSHEINNFINDKFPNTFQKLIINPIQILNDNNKPIPNKSDTDNYLSNIKYNIIRNVLIYYKNILENNTLGSSLDIISNLKKEINQDNNMLYKIILQITDNLIINYINHTLKKNTRIFIQDKLQNLFKNMGHNEQDKIIITKIDTGFELNLNTLFDEIITKFVKNYIVDQDDFNRLQYTTKIMQESSTDHSDQFIINEPDYTKQYDITAQLCYNINPDIVKLLVTHKININQLDYVQTTPIFYAIDTHNIKLVKEFINNGATIKHKSVKNSIGLTPLEYHIKSLQHHINIIYNNQTEQNNINTLLFNFYKPFYDNSIKKIESNAQYQNNIIKYIDIIFPQILLMYNNMFFLYMKKYIQNWSYVDYQNINKLLKKYSLITNEFKYIPLLDINDWSIIENNANLGVLSSKIDTNKQLIENQTSNKIQTQIDNIDKEITQLNKYNKDQIINKHIITLKNSKQVLENELKETLKNLNKYKSNDFFLKDNLNWGSNIVRNRLEKNIKVFYEDNNPLESNDIGKFYEDIFEKIITDNNKKYSNHQDYILYNELWKSYLNDNNKLNNIMNIHLLTIILQSKIINKIGTDISKETLEDIKNDISIINKLYKKIFIPIIKDYNELPIEPIEPTNNHNINYIETEITNITEHCISHIICSNMYYAVVKVLTKYIISINPKNYNNNILTLYKNEEEYSNYIADIIHRIINFDYDINQSNPKLLKYITKEMPILLIKSIQHNINTPISSLFNNIIIILQSNKVIQIDDDSSLIDNLQEHIFPYYQDLFTSVIPNIRIIIENYNRYIINGGRLLEILYLLLEKSTNEIN